MPAHRLWMKSGASGRAINLNHTPVGHKENADGQDVHGQAHHKGLEPQAEQRSQIHFHQPLFQIGHN